MSNLFAAYSIPQLEMVQHILTRLEIDGVDSLPIARQKIEEALRLGHRNRQGRSLRTSHAKEQLPVICPECGLTMSRYFRDDDDGPLQIVQCDGGGKHKADGCRYSAIVEEQ